MNNIADETTYYISERHFSADTFLSSGMLFLIFLFHYHLIRFLSNVTKKLKRLMLISFDLSNKSRNMYYLVPMFEYYLPNIRIISTGNIDGAKSSRKSNIGASFRCYLLSKLFWEPLTVGIVRKLSSTEPYWFCLIQDIMVLENGTLKLILLPYSQIFSLVWLTRRNSIRINLRDFLLNYVIPYLYRFWYEADKSERIIATPFVI